MSDHVPLAYGKLRLGRDCFTITVRCPHCGKQHVHGVGADGTVLGHRLAHCTTPPTGAGYVLAVKPEGGEA